MADLFYYDGALHSEQLTLENLQRLQSMNAKVWIDVYEQKDEILDVLSNAFGLHHLTTEDLKNLRTRVKIEDFDNYLFIILYGIKKEEDVDLVEMDFVLGENFLISNHPGRLDSYEQLKKNEEKLTRLFDKGMDFLLHKLIDKEIDNFFPVLEYLDEEIEGIEDEVIKKPNPQLLGKIHKIKSQITHIKKITMPQRDKLSFLAKDDHKFISMDAKIYFRDIYDHAIRVSDFIENYREAASNTLEIYLSSISNNMSEVMKVLSIIATIMLPLSFLTGLYGTNFRVLPGADNPYGFWAMALIMFALAMLMLLFFRSRKWL